MIDLPEQTQREIFRNNFIPGSIFRFDKFIFSDDSFKPKYILVLKECDDTGECSFCLTTSKVQKIKDNLILFRKHFIIEHGTIDCFNKETAINISKIYHRNYKILEQKFIYHTHNDEITFMQMMPEDLMKDIYYGIINSDFLSPNQILRIFPKPLFK